jgi:FtsP/CotA-like multicopper oxidase with cupredoxin domain
VGVRSTIVALLALVLLVLSVASGAPAAEPAPIIVPQESAGALLEPPVISSHNGVLQADVTLRRAGPPGSNAPTLFGGLPLYSNPTLPPASPSGRANPPKFPLNFAAGYEFTTPDGRSYPAQFPAPTLQVQPGDTVNLTWHNRLGDAPGPVLPQGALPTNLHTHGLIVSPLDEGDNAYRTILPNETYRSRVVIPSDHQPGVDWYHAHRHGYAADQVYGGLAGTLQIGDPLDPWPQYKGKYAERVFALTLGMMATDPKTGDRVLKDPNPGNNANLEPYGTTWRKYVNGQFNPTLTIRPGETQIWSFVGMERNGDFNLGITDGNGENPWQATIFSYDGNTNNVFPRETTLAPPVPFVFNGPTVLEDGARITMAVTAPAKPGTYYIVDNMHQRLKPMPQFWALATINVTGTPATEPTPNLTPNGPVPDLYTVTPDQHRTFDWRIVDDAQGRASFPINGYLFPDSPLVPIQVGQVEEWLLVNNSTIDHVFHLHQTDFAVIRVGSNQIQTGPRTTSANPYYYTSLRDSVDIPPGQSVIIRFRVSPELGKYFFHCHILPHEDGGMMMGVLALPNVPQRRIALGSLPGQPTLVLVKDGNGRTAGRVYPFGRKSTRGVSTITGQLTDDLTEDIVAAPTRSGSAPFISVYDGQSLDRIAHFRPFGNERVGVSVAVGNVNDQGIGEIIAGRVGPGPSLVRVFKPNGTPVTEIRGTIGGRLPNGVSVAAADFDGDNYDDVAVGAGRGHAPDIVGLSGVSLSKASSKIESLFSYTAGRGNSGVNLAAGYYDPVTRPGFAANLITTPQTGRVAGWAQVWIPYALDHMTGEVGPPRQIASFRPLGRRTGRGLSLQVGRLGTNALDALASWVDPTKPVFISIDDAGVLSRIQTPVTAAAAEHADSAQNAARKAGYELSLDTTRHAVRITRHGSSVRGADVTVTYTMVGMAMAPSSETLRETSAGVYSGRGPGVSMAGRWQLTIGVAPRGKPAFTARLVSVLPPANG